MNFADRIKGIVGDPRSEWPKIASEPATAQSLYTGWIMLMAAIGPLALLLSMHGLQIAIALYVMSLIVTFVLALIVDALAPSFGGTKDFVASLKLIAYSYTIVGLAGVFLLFGPTGAVVVLLALIYALYTFFLGAPVLRKASDAKAVPFTLVILLCLVVLLTLARFVVGGTAMAPHLQGGLVQLRDVMGSE